VLPPLLRALGAESSFEAAWAHCLLGAVAAPGKPPRERVLKRLNQLLQSPRHPDAVKARVMALLSDLGAPLGDHVVLQDPDALLAGSVRELLSSLDSAADLAQALDLIFSQVPVAELRQFLDEVAHHGGALARPLFSALIADPRRPAEVARHLMAQYRPTRLPPPAAPVRRPRPAGERMLTRLARALNLLGEGKLTQARSRLTRLLPDFPDQPAVHSALGLCLLRLGEPHQALAPLQRALELEPAVAAHAWNLAAAAQAAQRLSTCYRSLRRYLEQTDDSDGAASRRRTAELFCRSYSPKGDETPLVGTAQASLGED
jgi:tetratricopeptide (TPR) repeat protein